MRSTLKKFDKLCESIISESVIRKKFYDRFSKAKPISRKIPTIEQIKEELLKLSECTNWDHFLALKSKGDCDLIAKAVARMFPKIKMVSATILFSEDAKKKLDKEKGYECVHFLNKLNDKYIDFGKATNIYDGVYVLEGIDDIKSCEYSDEAAQHLTDEEEEDPKQLGTYLR